MNRRGPSGISVYPSEYGWHVVPLKLIYGDECSTPGQSSPCIETARSFKTPPVPMISNMATPSTKEKYLGALCCRDGSIDGTIQKTT